MAIINSYNYSRPKTLSRNDIGVKNNNQDRIIKMRQQNKDNQSNQYLESKIMSAKPEELTFMLYDGLVKFIKKAILSLDSKNYEAVNYNSQRAQAIIDELRSTLDMKIHISNHMDQLYEYLMNRVFTGNFEKNLDAFKEALEIAEDFRETWKKSFKISI